MQSSMCPFLLSKWFQEYCRWIPIINSQGPHLTSSAAQVESAARQDSFDIKECPNPPLANAAGRSCFSLTKQDTPIIC